MLPYPVVGEGEGMKQPKESVYYEFRIHGVLGDMLLNAFPDLHAEVQGDETVLWGEIPDQSALHGVLSQIEQLGLVLLDLHRRV
jgi:hypothetical protein